MKIWILEGFVTPEMIQEDIEKTRALAESVTKEEDLKLCQDMIESHEKRLEDHPGGYWMGYDGKTDYRTFCEFAKRTLRHYRDDNGRKWRVLKAEIPDDAKYWIGAYTNGVENEGVLRYLKATM